MKLRMRESKYGAPEGTYLGRFLGCKVLEDDGKPRLGRDGRPMEPGMEWLFEVTDDPDHEGQYAGQQVGRITSQTPTPGNACGTLLRGLLGRTPDPEEEVDTAPYVGQTYRVTLGPQRDKPEKTQVIQIARVKVGPAPAPAPGAAANGPTFPAEGAPPAGKVVAPSPKPPPRPPARAVAPPPVRYWVQAGEGDPKLMATHEVNAWLAEVKVPPNTVAACPEDGQGEDAWKTLADFGFADPVPF